MEHLTQKVIEDYSLSRLAAVELLTVSDHLAGCETCRRNLQNRVNTDDAFLTFHSEIVDSAPFPPHFPPEQVASYVEKTLSTEELQVARDHLASCELCALAVQDLQTFRNQIAPLLDREYKPAASDQPPAKQRSFKLLPSWLQSPWPVLAGASAILLLAALVWTSWRMRSEKAPTQEIAAAPSPSPEAQLPQASPSPQAPEQLTAQVELNDGGRRLTLEKNGSLSGVEDLGPAYQALVKRTLTSGRIEKSAQLNGLTRPGSSLMSSDQAGVTFSIKEPAGSVSLTDRPTFRWSKLEGAASYVVEVYNDSFQLILQSPSLTGESWTATQSLPRGAVYNWQVKASKDGQEITSPRPPAAQAKFRVLDQARTAEIENVRRTTPVSHLTLALLYADAGLLNEAEAELRELQKENPNSEFVKSLLQQVRALMRRR